ncbi:MAG: 50S ribosomal protein L10, partial [Clostridiales bacterium]|nr:50S ribosomal protein L10 [Clostridiales bacterium]
MPSEKILKQKQQVVESLAQRLNDAEVGILIDYKGINVAQDSELRRTLSEKEIEYNVVKNTLLKLAAEKVGIEGLDDVLRGSTSLATSADPIAPFAVIKKFSRKFGQVFNVKAAFI